MRTRGQEAKVSKPKTRARSRQDDPINLSTPRKATRSASNLSAQSEIIVGKASPTSPSLRSRRRGRVQALWKSPVLRIRGLGRRFLESLDKYLSDEEELIKEKSSPPASLDGKAAGQNGLPAPPETTNDHSNDPAKKEESPQEAIALEDQSLHPEAPTTETAKLQPKEESHVTAENSPNPSHQIVEELRQRVDQEREKDEGLATKVPTAAGSPDNDDQASASSQRSSLKGNDESGIEAPLASDETKVTSIEAPVIIVDEELCDDDLPLPFQEKLRNLAEEDCEDNADYILKTRFAPMTDQDAFINALTKTNPQQRPMDVLYAIAANTQAALKLWQDEYLAIDKRTAPHANIPRKPATGARNPIDPEIYEDMREAEIYGYTFDPKKIGQQNPFSQRSARGLKGRELRDRRNRDILDMLGLSEDDAGGGAAGPGRRTRKPTQKVEGNLSTSNLATTPETSRKRNLASMTPDTDAGGTNGPLKKRSRRAHAGPRADLLNPRIREMRAGSALTATTSEEEDTEGDDGDLGDLGDERDGAFRGSARASSGGPMKRRGRPKGSKNLAKRPDAGIKKGPRATWAKKLLPAATLAGIDESRAGTPSGLGTDMEESEKMVEPLPPPPQQQQQHAPSGSFATQQYVAAPGAGNVLPVYGPQTSYLGSFPVDLGHPAPPLPPRETSVAPPPSSAVSPSKPPSRTKPALTSKRPGTKTTTPSCTITSPAPGMGFLGPLGASKPTTAPAAAGLASPGDLDGQKRRQQAKSEKRSKSMTLWWAERKKRQAEANVQRLQGGPAEGAEDGDGEGLGMGDVDGKERRGREGGRGERGEMDGMGVGSKAGMEVQ
ncbi:MAG: hypothetical protein M1821_002012 [Bathelium mastoideum]|nr:MAG: hypothetical protein M1821_002012 [Bathelium mastoideum]